MSIVDQLGRHHTHVTHAQGATSDHLIKASAVYSNGDLLIVTDAPWLLERGQEDLYRTALVGYRVVCGQWYRVHGDVAPLEKAINAVKLGSTIRVGGQNLTRVGHSQVPSAIKIVDQDAVAW